MGNGAVLASDTILVGGRKNGTAPAPFPKPRYVPASDGQLVNMRTKQVVR